MNRLSALAGIVAALLAMGWLNLRWLDRPLNLSPIVSERPAPATGLDGAPQEPAGSVPELRAGMTEALLRPLFHANRRPFTPPPVEAAAPPPEVEVPPLEALAEPEQLPAPQARPELRLAGVSLSGTARRALLGSSGGSEMRWYSQGDSVDGWVVASITNGAVILASGEQSFTVALYPSSAPGGGGQ